jgi:hypothetical protein
MMVTDYDLSLDKITITFNQTSRRSLEKMSHTLESFRNPDIGPFANVSFSKYYRFSGSFMVSGQQEPATVFFQALPIFPRGSDCRLEWNPAKVDADGLSTILQILEKLELDPLRVFSTGTVQRADFALDLFGLTADDVIAHSTKARKHQVVTGTGGLVESAYCGSPRGSNRIVVYTKRYKNVPEHRAIGLRLERRNKPMCSGSELKNVANPFAGIKIIRTESLVPLITTADPLHLFDSLRLRWKHALSHMPLSEQKAIIEAFNDPSLSLMPDIEEVWRQWPEVLARNGLGRVLDGSRNRLTDYFARPRRTRPDHETKSRNHESEVEKAGLTTLNKGNESSPIHLQIQKGASSPKT